MMADDYFMSKKQPDESLQAQPARTQRWRADRDAVSAAMSAAATGAREQREQRQMLLARVRSILRRRAVPAAAPDGPRRFASFAGCTLDCAANVLRAADASEHLLGTAEMQVLRAFVDRPHQILTREQLVGTRDLSDLDRSIDVRISRLRRKVEADPQNAKIIKTVYGAGYMFAAAVAWS